MKTYTALFLSIFLSVSNLFAQSAQTLMNETVDLSKDFKDYLNTYFLADSLAAFNPQTSSGAVKWRRARYSPAHAFDYTQHALQRTTQNEFPAAEYAADPVLPFSLEFVSAKTVRLKMQTGTVVQTPEPSLMLVNDPLSNQTGWQYSKIKMVINIKVLSVL